MSVCILYFIILTVVTGLTPRDPRHPSPVSYFYKFNMKYFFSCCLPLRGLVLAGDWRDGSDVQL